MILHFFGLFVRLEGVNRVIVPFLACGDLGAYDSDKTYDVGQDDGLQYVPLPPVQGPINPPYKTACYLKKNSLLASQKTMENTEKENNYVCEADKHDSATALDL